MTLQEEKSRLIAEMLDRYVKSDDMLPIEFANSLADALLEEVAKVADAEADKCFDRQNAPLLPPDEHSANNWAMAALSAKIVASAIRSGKGK